MRFEGTLSAWNADGGYGSIRPLGGGDEVFVALAAFPTDGDGPRLDEPLSFEIVTGRDGRKQAVQLKRLPAAQRSAALREATGIGHQRVRQAQRKRRLGLAAGAVFAVALVVGGVRLWPGSHAGDVPPSMRR
ncbi:cold-shock protein [Roseateles sp. DC23W]|uniref:Cold-shock protein n=1 Tax=Pelomonas dachongensis TaxID=3299029 RepID=A0ABW7EQH4_9BURK